MKTLLTMAIICLCSLANGQSDKKYIAINTANEKVTIDGKDDESFWKYAVKDSIPLHMDDMVLSPTDYSAYFKVAYDSKNLYCMAYVTDNALVSRVDVGAEAWNSDCIEMFFNPRDSTEDTNTFPMIASDECHFMAGVDDSEFANQFNGSGYIDSHNSNKIGYKFHTNVTANGYMLEMQCPWKFLYDSTANNAPKIKIGTQIHWDINGCDADDASGRKSIMGWNTDWTEDWRNNSQYGILELGKSFGVAVQESKNGGILLLRNGHSKSYTLKLNGNASSNTKLSIYNTNGNEVYNASYKIGGSYQIDLSSCSSGLYVAKMAYSDKVVTQKIIIQ